MTFLKSLKGLLLMIHDSSIFVFILLVVLQPHDFELSIRTQVFFKKLYPEMHELQTPFL